MKFEVPDAVGVPEIAPDEAFRLSPAGREPVLTLHEYGVVPPLACKVAEYAVPTVPLGRDAVEIAIESPPDPDPPPELLLEGAPVVPAQPFRTATDAIRSAAMKHLPVFVEHSLESRASMFQIPSRACTVAVQCLAQTLILLLKLL